MLVVSLDEAVASLAEIVQLAQAGELVTITRQGLPVVHIIASGCIKQDFPSLAELRDKLPFQTEPAGDFIRRMRNQDRY